MKICSWNVCFYNKKTDIVLSFIKNLDFDVLCLQEVSENLLKKLKQLHYIESHIDCKRLIGKRWVSCYLVILTKFKIKNTKKFYIARKRKLPLRTKIFIKLMRVFNWTKLKDQGTFYIDVEKGKKTYRVFSTHLLLQSPMERYREMKIISNHLSRQYENIVCGDFNIPDQFFIKPFQWLLGSSISEASPFYPERKRLEAMFQKLGLQNPLKGRRTHSIFKSQFDHVLIPKNSRVLNAKVLNKPFGSDHYPVFVEVQE